MECWLTMVRHGATRGNLERRYVGTTDEGLLQEAVAALRQKRLPEMDLVLGSPLRRCRETAEALFPGCSYRAVEELRECDFGAFEYRTYEELREEPAYQRFLCTLGAEGFPGGETREAFQSRCARGFEKALQEAAGCGATARGGRPRIALVVHGGTIMALLDRFSVPHRDYYQWQTANAEGFTMRCLWERGRAPECREIRGTKL